MRFLGSLFGAIKSIFDCLSMRAARSAGRAESTNDVLTAQEKTYFAMRQAERIVPEEVDRTLREGKL